MVQRNERLKAMLGAAEAPAPAPDASGMDVAEQQATDLDFFDAVEYVNNQPLGLDDAVQRKLFGLYCVATDGALPSRVAKNLSRDERAKDAAWRAAFGDHPRASDARRAYVDEVIRQAPDFLLLPPEEDETWMQISESQLEGQMAARAAPGAARGRGEAVVLGEAAQSLHAFVSTLSGPDGAEVPRGCAAPPLTSPSPLPPLSLPSFPE